MKTLATLLLSGLLSGVLLSGCTGKSTDDTSNLELWCETAADANSDYSEEGGGSVSSGKVIGRIINVVDEDLHDPNVIGGMDYTLSPVGSGGGSTAGETDSYGEFYNTVGEGTWLFESGGRKGGYTCSSTYEFEVVAGRTSYLCIDAGCE